MTTQLPSTPPPPRHRYLSRDERLQVQTLRRSGHTHQSIADQLNITLRQVGYAIANENVSPKRRTGRPSQLSKEQVDELENFVRSSREIRQMSYQQLATGPFKHWNVSRKVIRAALRTRGYSRDSSTVQPLPTEVKQLTRERQILTSQLCMADTYFLDSSEILHDHNKS
ncbi:hypothetical protein EPUL_004944 [Erysiphe pulchra]|uniref:Transposase IS30-like HTH domain-containing protein n=1 Tax=Erysiphe pulchra TaxID=225359 RepID=A0A2S4PND0_9PEZI|nr:hypothetical protein EPUL_004944 [Erysiphe pulchra]